MHSFALSILYLDDSLAALREGERALTTAGHTVKLALNIREAQGKLAGTDLVIIDFHMPEMDGAQAMRELRSLQPAGARPAYYLYTSDTTVAGRFKQLGFDGAITWKGNLEALSSQVQAIARILKMRRFMSDRRA